MAKIYDNRPVDWDDKDESGAKSQSSVSEYKSGKVQKNVVNDNSIVQEDYAESQKKKLLSSSEVRETSKGNITTTYEDDTKLTQQSKTAKESYHSNDFKSEIKKETIVTKTANKTESIIADSTTISTNKLTETSHGKHAITATKNINIKSNQAKISAEKLDVKGASFGMSAKKHTEKAPFKHVKAGDVKYNVSEKLMMDADISKSSFKLQNYQTKQAEYKHPDDVADDVYYIGEVIYSPKLSKLYFVPTNLVREVFSSQQKYLNKSKTNSVYKYNYGKRQVANRFDTSPDLEQVLLSNRDYIHISFVRASMCMLDQSVVSNPNIVSLDFSKAKLDGNTSLINWGTINSDLDSKVKGLGYKAGYKFANQDAVDDGVKYLQSLSENNINRWLDIGKTYQASLLYMGLLMAGRYNFKQISEKQARLPYKPDVIADIDYDNETAIAYKSYQHEIDEDYGVFDLVTTEEYVDSEILLSQTVKVAIKGNKYTLEGDNHSKYPTDKDNQIKDGLLLWSRTVSTKHDKKIEKLNLGRLKIKDLESKQLIKPYQIDYKDDKWLVYADSKYLLSTHNHDLDYPIGDALIFEATVDEHYILEKFYYYQEARHQFELDEDIVAKDTKQKLSRRGCYESLLDTYEQSSDEKMKSYLESLQEDGKTVSIQAVIEGLEKASDELILALVPDSVGKLLYLLNNLNEEDQKLVQTNQDLAERRVKLALKLVATFNTRKGYLIALQHYQPLTEYDQVKAEDSVDALWHNDDMLFASSDDKTARLINGAYNKLNSEDMVLRLRKDEDLFYKHEYLDFVPVEIAAIREADDIVHDLKEEDQEDTNQPLTDLPDKDASVLCELVYEKSALEYAFKDPLMKKVSLANIFYDVTKKYKNDKGQVIYPVRDDKGFNLSDDFKYALENYRVYYYNVLKKYKLITTSNSQLSNSVDYYSIVIAHAKDKSNSGVYVINRGTDSKHNLFVSDISMALSQSPEIFKIAINFVKDRVINEDISFIGFSGHSLGGSITQAQVVYFEGEKKKKYKLSMSKAFEPFGISAILNNLIIQYRQAQMLKNPPPMGALNFDSMALSASTNVNALEETNMFLRERYVSNSYYNQYISSFYRVGDAVAEQELKSILGNVQKIETDYSVSEVFAKSIVNNMVNDLSSIGILSNSIFRGVSSATITVAKDKFYNLHTMKNYKYQGYNGDSGSLLPTQINQTNVDKLYETQDAVEIARYKLVFRALD
ncbi:hypothetical protein [Francisella marina]|uniref:hypothetical protein n=1 Tax=Francisella marina TaxID=2249302 RepID=UPI0011EBAA8A|nr:hypothetical protein [Francisella marina]QEO60024.1 hypothetical protein F0R75_09575 [Francisella marina]